MNKYIKFVTIETECIICIKFNPSILYNTVLLILFF